MWALQRTKSNREAVLEYQVEQLQQELARRNTEFAQFRAESKEQFMAVLAQAQAIVDKINNANSALPGQIQSAVARGVADAEANKDGDTKDSLDAIDAATDQFIQTAGNSTTPTPAPGA